ncbi:MAG: isochorismatase [Bacteroidetes bacterium]|nr:isochorismatase [Bacteroidota bacterium]
MEENNQHTALLVMDMQSPMLAMIADPAAIKTNVAKAIAHARAKKIPVLYIVVGFRAGLPEVSTSTKSGQNMRVLLADADLDAWMKIDAFIVPLPGEPTIIKRRTSAFTGSDLEVILRAQNIKHLVLTGIATSGVVLSTVREASDKDYNMTVLSDCCADRDPEVHQVLITKVFARQADVITVNEWSNM